LVALGLLFRVRRFVWGRHLQVVRWTLLAYMVIAARSWLRPRLRPHGGGYPGRPRLILVVLAVDVPMVIACTVARYEEVGDDPSSIRRLAGKRARLGCTERLASAASKR
jgi:hypothetical protein